MISDTKIRNYIKEAILVNTFIIDVFVSSISNYSFSSLILKSSLTAVLFLLIIFHYKKTPSQANSPFNNVGFRKSAYIIAVFLLISLVSLIYSHNREFGFLKWISLVISTFPAVLAFYFLISTINQARIQVFKGSIIFLSIIAVIPLLFFNPFLWEGFYSFSIFRWSHVIYGRFISSIFIILIFFLANLTNRKYLPVLTLISALGLLGIYLTGLRAALLGLIILVPVYITYKLIKKEIQRYNLAGILASFILAGLLIAGSGGRDNLSGRYEELGRINSSELTGVGSFDARLTALDICISRIKENPVLGIGFGGFRSYYGSEIPLWMKYPHNIVLEFVTELGIPGLLFLIFLLYTIFRNSQKISIEALIFFAFAFWLSLFSKDIPGQTALFIGLGLINFKYPDTKDQASLSINQKP